MTALRQDVRALRPIALPPDIDAVDIDFCAGERVLARVEAAVAGSIAPREVMQMALEAVGLRRFLRESHLPLHWQWWLLFASHLLRVAIRLAQARLRRTPLPAQGFRQIVGLVLRRSALSCAGPPVIEGSTERAAARLMNRTRSAAALPAPVVLAVVPQAKPQSGGATDRVPVLMYHRIADDGPPTLAPYRVSPADFTAQMRWLHLHGYHTITSDDIARHLTEGRRFEGKPVLLSFDDGYRDFHDVAWPILRAQGFRAEVFIVTGLVGGAAEWDAQHGPPAPLMGWREIQKLAAAGVRFGSHMASHSHVADLSLRQITEEAAGSRATLEQVLGRECRSIASPYGEDDRRFVRIAHACGYHAAFTVRPGVARLGDDPLRLPRIQVHRDITLSTFAQMVE